MCIIAVAMDIAPDRPLIVAANRDERHERPTAALARWPGDRGGIIAGGDLAGGGTWLGVSPAGRLAAVTNIRQTAAADPAAPSRGRFVAGFLDDGALPDEADAARANPFNLLTWAAGRATRVANRPNYARVALPVGLTVIANTAPGLVCGRAAMLGRILSRRLTGPPPPPRDLLDILGTTCAATGPDGETIFLRDPEYGTRCSTFVVVDRHGRGVIVERRYDRDGEVAGESFFDFAWPSS